MKTNLFLLILGMLCLFNSAVGQSTALSGFNGSITFSAFANNGLNVRGTLKDFKDQTGQYVASQIDTGDIAWDNNGKRYAVVAVISSTSTQAVVDLSRIGGGTHNPKGAGLVSRETSNGLTLIPTANSQGISAQLLGRILTHNIQVMKGWGNGIISALPLGDVNIQTSNDLYFKDNSSGFHKTSYKNSSGATGTEIYRGNVNVSKISPGSSGGFFRIIDTTGVDNTFYEGQLDFTFVQNPGSGPQLSKAVSGPKVVGFEKSYFGVRNDTTGLIPIIRIMYGDRYSGITSPDIHHFIGAIPNSANAYTPSFYFDSRGSTGKLGLSFDNTLFVRENGKVYIGQDSSFSHNPLDNSTVALGELILGYDSEGNKLSFSKVWNQNINADGFNGNFTIRNGSGAGFQYYYLLGTPNGIDTMTTLHHKGLGVRVGKSSKIDATLHANFINGSNVNNIFRLDNAGNKVFSIETSGQVVVTSTIWLNSTKTVGIFLGTGSPEGVVTASVGSTFSRTNGGAGTSFYVKESGSGNTGWVAK